MSYVCVCMTVTEAHLLDAFIAGDGSVADVIARTKATGGCGTCKQRVERLVKRWRWELRLKGLVGRWGK
ncbi:MAG: (2Fe-2S)-binding protein [Bradymonadia bacterium]